MSAEKNKAVVRRWNEEIIRGRKIQAFAEVPDSNYTLHTLNLHGIDEAKKHCSELFRKYPEMSFYRLSAGKIVDDWFCSRDLR